MKPGDLVRLNNQGYPVRIAPVPYHSGVSWERNTYPVGTLAVVIEIGEVGKDGPGMETPALVMVGDVVGWTWLYELELVSEA